MAVLERHAEHLLPAPDPQGFAMHRVDLAQDLALRERLAANARRLIEERYDWRQVGEGFVSLVQDVYLKRQGSPL